MTNDDREVLMRVRKALDAFPFTLTDLAERSGLSYAALHSWNHTERVPRLASRQKLAAGLREKARELEALAAEVESVDGG